MSVKRSMRRKNARSRIKRSVPVARKIQGGSKPITTGNMAKAFRKVKRSDKKSTQAKRKTKRAVGRKR